MERNGSTARTLTRQAATVVLLLLVAGAYFALVVPGRTAYFKDRYFRQLAEGNDNLREIIWALCSSLTNAAAQGTVTNLPNAAQSTATNSEAAIRNALKLSPYFSATKISLTDASRTDKAGLSLRVVTNVPSPVLELDFVSTNGMRVTTYSELNELVRAFVNHGEFRDVLWSSQAGAVLMQLSPGSLRLNDLGFPVRQTFTTNLVNLAGGDYRLFAQPARITAPSAEGSVPLEWVLCGLVREEQFRRQTWAMDYTVLAAFCFAGLMLVVSWPLLNLWGGGAQKGLGAVDLTLLALSGLFVTALVALVALDRHAYSAGKAQVDDRLKLLASNVLTNLNQELVAVAGELERLDKAAQTRRDWTNVTNLLNQGQPSSLNLTQYPWFRMAFWAGRDGMQTHKWTAKSNNTPMINVSRRAYFRTIAEGRGWINDDGWTTNVYCFEPIFSWNTGENLAIYSTPAIADANQIAAMDLCLLSLVRPVLPEGYGFAVVDGTGSVLFHSDERRNLRENLFTECGNPADLLGIVQGRTAGTVRVSYLQSPHRMFITPIQGLPWSLVVFYDTTRVKLAELGIVAVGGLLFLVYAGGLAAAVLLWRFVTGPRAFDWLWPRRSAEGDYWTLAQWLVVLVAATMLAAVWNPDPFVTFIIALAAAAAGLILVRGTLAAGWKMPHWLKFRRGWRGCDYRHGYVVALGMLLILLGVTPALLFFRIAFDQQVTLMVKQSQLKLARDLEARTDRVRLEVLGRPGLERKSNDGLSVSNADAFITNRLASKWDVYDFNCDTNWSSRERTLVKQRPPGLGERFREFLHTIRPHYTDLDVAAGGLWRDAAGDGGWGWERRRGVLDFRKVTPSGTRHISSPLPRWVLPQPFSLLILLAVLAVPFGIVLLVAERVLLLGEAEPIRSRPPWRTGKYLLLGPPHSKKSGLLTAENFAALARKPDQLNLRCPEDRARLAPARLDEWFTDTERPIVVDHFEFLLDDPKFNREKFHFLHEFDSDERRPLIIVSNVHPLLFPLAPDTEADPPSATVLARAKRQRAETLAAYKKIYKDGEADLTYGSLPGDATGHLVRAHFRSLWLTCSPKEQEVLHQVARGRLVGGHQTELGPLLERKLLMLDPGLQLLPDERFRRFILAHYQPDPDAEMDERASLWQAMKAPAATALVVVAAFFYLTQPALWQHTIGLTPAFLAGLGALMQVLGLFKRSKPAARPPQD